MSDEEPIESRFEMRDPRTLTLLERNARFMRKEVYDQLVANMRRDRACTSTVLVWDSTSHPAGLVLSGNHRAQAAIDADLTEIPCMVIDQDLSRARQIALQLSHNAITGEDDEATLRALYQELDDVDWRAYSGLDDKALSLLADVELESLTEANLTFASVTIVFLPHELERARTALAEARKLIDSGELWLAAYRDYDPTLDALATTQASYGILNVATALGLLIALAERHMGEYRDVWYEPLDGTPLVAPSKHVPLESIFETRTAPADAAAVIARAVDRMVKRGEVDDAQRWRALELWAADYLAGPE